MVVLQHLLHLLGASWASLVASLGTTTLAILAGLGIFILSLVVTAYRKGLESVKAHVTQTLRDGVTLTLIVWVALYGWNVAKTIYVDHRELVSLSGDLKGQIKKLKERDVVAPLSPDGGRMEIGQMAISPPTATTPFFINVHTPNNGKSAAVDEVHSESFRLTRDDNKPLTSADEYNGIEIALAGLSHQKPTGNEIQPGDAGTWFTANDDFLKPADFTQVLKGDRLLYFFVVIQWRDKTMPGREVGITEFCGYFTKTFTFYHVCTGHNRTYPKKPCAS
jgi:hypothetical protein